MEWINGLERLGPIEKTAAAFIEALVGELKCMRHSLASAEKIQRLANELKIVERELNLQNARVAVLEARTPEKRAAPAKASSPTMLPVKAPPAAPQTTLADPRLGTVGQRGRALVGWREVRGVWGMAGGDRKVSGGRQSAGKGEGGGLIGGIAV